MTPLRAVMRIPMLCFALHLLLATWDNQSCANLVVTAETEVQESTKRGKCETEEDLDFETCNVEDLSIPELKAICERMGLDVEKDIFTYLFDDEEDHDPDKKDWVQEDYVSGAYECLLIEQETQGVLDEEDLAAQELLDSDPELLADYVAEALKADPDLVTNLEDDLINDEPELYEAMKRELKEGEQLRDRPDILAQLLLLLMKEDPEVFKHLTSDLGSDSGFASEL